MLRRSTILKSGVPVIQRWTKKGYLNCESADVCISTFSLVMTGIRWNGDLKMLRLIDPKWIFCRFRALERNGYWTAVVFHGLTYWFFWQMPLSFYWGEGAPPRAVDWNPTTTGELPENYESKV